MIEGWGLFFLVVIFLLVTALVGGLWMWWFTAALKNGSALALLPCFGGGVGGLWIIKECWVGLWSEFK